MGIFSLEGVFAAFGLYSLGTGLRDGSALPVFWGASILVGLGILTAVRRRDWQQHWRALEQQASTDQPGDPVAPNE